MTSYTILRTENLPESLRGKPRWVVCAVFTAGLLIMTFSAVAAGVFIGYTYCYVEHRNGFRPGNMTQTPDFRIYNVPLGDAEEGAEKHTINGAILSSQLVQKILKIGNNLWTDEHVYLPGTLDEKKLGILQISSNMSQAHVETV